MMENQQWPVKYQQSGAGADTAQDNLNNGEKSEDGKEQNGEGPQDNDQQNENNCITISEKARQLIALILDQMKELSNAEKYLLYLKLFQISNVVDPLRQPLNPLGSRSEINRTISWIKTHLEEDAETSLPKQEVYEQYTLYCSQNQIKSLSQADFGKVMKQVYPKVRARRLGTRGNSRYCYSGLRRCIKLKPPKLPDLGDKPLSTEAPCTQSTLTAAAWLIVKEWSEFHFKVQFPSLQALARFLVVSHSVGVGTDAANQLTLASESQLKGELCGGKSGTKHREMQLQLQKKIQQKNEVKERKRKMQSPKSDPKSSGKKTKAASAPIRLDEPSPTLTGAGESSTSTSTGSTSTSPTQGKPICDKSLDFTQLPALPDFKSFQKPICEQPQQQNGVGTAAKVAIPRLVSSGMKAQQQQRSPQSSPKKQVKNAKYKAIQPKPQPCDNASYNPQPTADIRSQGVLHNVDRFKEKKCTDDDCDAPVFPLPRERLESISNVDKDAMDEYLGTNNSQHEEELSKYFSNNIETADSENTTKISQLRQLLEQNGISDNKNFLVENSPTVTLTNPIIDPLTVQNVSIYPAPVQTNQTAVPPSNSSARRRVSFETPFHEDTVPPSPNTRRKNFSFTPISPGPQSPNGRQSKCSSTNVSPFVSPRNTPVPRAKNSTHQNAGIGVKKRIKREPELSVDVSESKGYMPMSAPASPMYNNKSVLEKLLCNNSKVAYTPDYVTTIKQDVSSEVDLMENENVGNFSDFTYRSQSVPINQMIKSNFNEDSQFLPNLSNQNADFNDFDPISESVTVNRIIDALDEQQCEGTNNIEMYNVDITQNNPCIPDFNLIVDNNLEIQNTFGDNIPYNPGSRALGRSQSIDVNSCYDIKNNNPNPSRSVPNTPLSFNKPPPVKDFTNHSSRSYPSTPLLVPESAFNYAVNGDCLLNGQPIRSGAATRDQDSLTYFMNLNEANEDNNVNRHLTAEDEFSIGRGLQGNEFGMVENENALMDEDGVLIGEQNYN